MCGVFSLHNPKNVMIDYFTVGVYSRNREHQNRLIGSPLDKKNRDEH
jgi:hypothetical protein